MEENSCFLWKVLNERGCESRVICSADISVNHRARREAVGQRRAQTEEEGQKITEWTKRGILLWVTRMPEMQCLKLKSLWAQNPSVYEVSGWQVGAQRRRTMCLLITENAWDEWMEYLDLFLRIKGCKKVFYLHGGLICLHTSQGDVTTLVPCTWNA